MTNSAQAVQDAGVFLTAHANLSDSREVRVVAPFSAGEYEIDLGTLRALYALAVAALGMRQKIDEAEAAYRAATGE